MIFLLVFSAIWEQSLPPETLDWTRHYWAPCRWPQLHNSWPENSSHHTPFPSMQRLCQGIEATRPCLETVVQKGVRRTKEQRCERGFTCSGWVNPRLLCNALHNASRETKACGSARWDHFAVSDQESPHKENSVES